MLRFQLKNPLILGADAACLQILSSISNFSKPSFHSKNNMDFLNQNPFNSKSIFKRNVKKLHLKYQICQSSTPILPQISVAKLAETPCSAVSASSPMSSPIFTRLVPWMCPVVQRLGCNTCTMEMLENGNGNQMF